MMCPRSDYECPDIGDCDFESAVPFHVFNPVDVQAYASPLAPDGGLEEPCGIASDYRVYILRKTA